jgi:hypothetical protein
MNYVITYLVILICVMVSPTSQGQDLETQKKALKVISDFATEMCGQIPLEGTSDNLDLSGNAKAKLNNTITKIVDLGVEGAAKYKTDEYKGLLRTDLIKALSESKNCKLEVWRDLKNKLLGLSDSPTPVANNNQLSRTCNYVSGRKAGQIEYFPPSVPIIPTFVGASCRDAQGSWGYAIQDQ